jgi:hypothetical protein
MLQPMIGAGVLIKIILMIINRRPLKVTSTKVVKVIYQLTILTNKHKVTLREEIVWNKKVGDLCKLIKDKMNSKDFFNEEEI